MSRRDQIQMTSDEVDEFLASERVVVCATNGRRGWPHIMPLWYVIRDGELWGWTYAKSQKIRNLERDPRATIQIEAGEQYNELRGVMIETRPIIHRDLDTVTEVGADIFRRYGTASLGPEFLEIVRAQATKRVALQFVPERLASWDHRKLGGVY
jgi:hypothetical protein